LHAQVWHGCRPGIRNCIVTKVEVRECLATAWVAMQPMGGWLQTACEFV